MSWQFEELLTLDGAMDWFLSSIETSVEAKCKEPLSQLNQCLSSTSDCTSNYQATLDCMKSSYPGVEIEGPVEEVVPVLIANAKITTILENKSLGLFHGAYQNPWETLQDMFPQQKAALSSCISNKHIRVNNSDLSPCSSEVKDLLEAMGTALGSEYTEL